MTKNPIIWLVLLLVVSATYMACTKSANDSGRNPCLEPKRYFLTMQISTPADTGSAGVALEMPSPVVGLVDTSVWFDGSTGKASSFTGPLSGIVDSTRWFVFTDTLRPTEIDTLTFYYSRTPVFISTSCGYAFTYSLQRVVTTGYYMDSARIDKSEVNGASDIVHVKIFY